MKCYLLNIWPNAHISGQRVLDLEILCILTIAFWCHISRTVVHIWPNEHISGKLVLDLELSNTNSLIHSDLTSAIYEPILTYETNFSQISPQWWTFYINCLTPFDDTSAIECCLFDLYKYISGKLVIDHERSIHTHLRSFKF